MSTFGLTMKTLICLMVCLPMFCCATFPADVEYTIIALNRSSQINQHMSQTACETECPRILIRIPAMPIDHTVCRKACSAVLAS
ncbi:hypothetical protein DPMN_059024 [Dreissena polymorpha]|uniref:Uncharacterized protein n=1 Tax=Dreissena polymorpha TaxID=45954 RepID=A0A9D4C361_DREPO|nr:hypothetical protein DPMN_059024 [Dreissena polymorpha]